MADTLATAIAGTNANAPASSEASPTPNRRSKRASPNTHAAQASALRNVIAHTSPPARTTSEASHSCTG